MEETEYTKRIKKEGTVVRKLSLHGRKERKGQEMMVTKVNTMTERNTKEEGREIKT
jgi:hypothetical protein